MEDNKEVVETLEEEKIDKKESKKEKKNKYQEQIKELENKVKELEDKNIRVTAEMVNSLRRKEEENTRLLKFASESLIIDLLSTIDNFERALSVKTDNADIQNYQKGFDMIYQNLVNTLKKYEVKEIECLGHDFDPTYHQAVMTDHIDGKKENEIIEVMQKGYTYKDKVIRPAMVKVNN